jgi:hypothetical protein
VLTCVVVKAAQAAVQNRRAAELQAHFETQAQTQSRPTASGRLVTNPEPSQSGSHSSQGQYSPERAQGFTDFAHEDGRPFTVDELREAVLFLNQAKGKGRSGHSSGSGSGSPHSSCGEVIGNAYGPTFEGFPTSRVVGRSSPERNSVIKRPSESITSWAAPASSSHLGRNGRLYRHGHDDADIEDMNGTLASLGISDHTTSWPVGNDKKSHGNV